MFLLKILYNKSRKRTNGYLEKGAYYEKGMEQILLGALTLCVLASGCGGGNGGGGTPEDPNADLPVRKKISTPVASSFKVDGRTVNIYEYTGLTFKDQILWTDTLAVDGDRIYFFGFDNKDETYRTKLRSVSFKDETLSDLKVLDERAYWRDKLVVSNGTVYDWHKQGDYKSREKKNESFLLALLRRKEPWCPPISPARL